MLDSVIADLFAAAVSANRGNLLIVTQNVSAATLTDWTRTMVRFRQTPPEAAEFLETIFKEIDTLRPERNALVHGLWGTDRSPEGTVMVQTIRIGRSEPVRDRLVTAAELDALIHDTVTIRQALDAFCREHCNPHAT